VNFFSEQMFWFLNAELFLFCGIILFIAGWMLVSDLMANRRAIKYERKYGADPSSWMR